MSVDPPPIPEELAESSFWRQQYQLNKISLDNTVPHVYARSIAIISKLGTSPPPPGVEGAADVALRMVKDETLRKLASTAPQTPGRRPGTNMIEKRERKEEEKQRHINEDINHQFWTLIDMSGQGLSTLSNRVLRYQFLQRVYLNNNNLTKVPECLMQLSQVRVIDLSQNRIEILPAQLGLMSNLRVLLLFNNKVHNIPFELGSLFQLQLIGLLGNPCINEQPEIREILTANGTRGLIEYLRDKALVGAPPKPREWIELIPQENKDLIVRMMSYNTLCEQYATPSMYGYTPSWALSWDYRSKLLVEEVLSQNMDIVCLQEVNLTALENLWIPIMESKGYSHIFYTKTRARTMAKPADSKLVDGCVTFFKKSKFALVEKYPVEYNSKALLKDGLKKSTDIFNRVMTRDNIAIIGVLTYLPTNQKVIVANTHLHWDPAFNDVKLIQTALLLEETEMKARAYAKQENIDFKKIPTLIAGDFNSIVNSGVVELLNHGTIPPNHSDMQGHYYGRFTEEGIQHNLPLKVAYPADKQLPFTNYTPDFVEVIDYIVYSTSSLKVNAILGKVDPQYAKKYVGFPNAHHPSDHIPIAVQVEFVK